MSGQFLDTRLTSLGLASILVKVRPARSNSGSVLRLVISVLLQRENVVLTATRLCHPLVI
jgi:hypothetical protein